MSATILGLYDVLGCERLASAIRPLCPFETTPPDVGNIPTRVGVVTFEYEATKYFPSGENETDCTLYAGSVRERITPFLSTLYSA